MQSAFLESATILSRVIKGPDLGQWGWFRLRVTDTPRHTQWPPARAYTQHTRAVPSSGSIIFDTRVRNIQNTRSRRMQRTYVRTRRGVVTVGGDHGEGDARKSAWKTFAFSSLACWEAERCAPRSQTDSGVASKRARARAHTAEPRRIAALRVPMR